LLKDSLYLKNEFRANEKKSTSRGVAVGGRNLYRQYLSRFKSYKFEIPATLRQLGWIDAPHTQKFEIMKSLE
jgi:hypothetical protein